MRDSPDKYPQTAGKVCAAVLGTRALEPPPAPGTGWCGEPAPPRPAPTPQTARPQEESRRREKVGAQLFDRASAGGRAARLGDSAPLPPPDSARGSADRASRGGAGPNLRGGPGERAARPWPGRRQPRPRPRPCPGDARPPGARGLRLRRAAAWLWFPG